ncbi:MAG: acyl carrier protein [Proteobacteria bacterium]|nr:acyl carrier protein [Pseudomonadota bacterium]MBU1708509.1 acyl carrier protein [Pseudomonadota bacterium]
MGISEQEIRKTIIDVVCRSLACDPEDIHSDSRLIIDLGMDSLDFVDVIFTLEKVFKAKVRDSELNKLLRPDKTAIAKMPAQLTDDEIRNLQHLIPALQKAAENGPVLRQNMFDYITIETLVRMVTAKLANQDSRDKKHETENRG